MTAGAGPHALPFLAVAVLVTALSGTAGILVSATRPSDTTALVAPAAADTVVRVWSSTVTATTGARAQVAVRIDMTGSGEALGRFRGRARFTPTLLNFEGFTPGDAEGELAVDTTRAEGGVLGFELDSGGATGTSGAATLAEITFWVTAPPGGLAPIVLELDLLEAAASGTDLLGRTEVLDGTVLVR